MKHDKTTAIGVLLAGLFISGLILATSSTVVAQNETPKKSTTVRRSSGGRDPFKRYEPPRQIVKKISGQVLPPSIQERIALYKAQKLAAMNARMPAPKPTTALLLSEIQVVGISRTPRGYAAIVEATPIKLTYVIYPGEPFYDGQLVAIEDARLVFRHELVFTDGRRERSVQLKNLRQADSVNAMSTTGAATTVAAAKP
jgi:hypothetical protein